MRVWGSSTASKIMTGALLCAFFAIFLVIIAGYRTNDEESFIRKISSQCSGVSTQQRQECLRGDILAYVDAHPEATSELFSRIWKLLQQGVLPDDARIFSPIAHEVGMLLYEKGIALTDAMRFCDLSFRGGCIHGVFMEYVDSTYTHIDPETLVQECARLSDIPGITGDRFFGNCAHALGHEFVAKGKGSLNNILSLCTALPDTFINDCAYGVFMEYSKGEPGGGHHSERPVGQAVVDCRAVDNSFKKVCYTSLGFYKQYEIDSEPWEQTYRSCEGVPVAYQNNCYNGVGGALLFSFAFVQEKALAVCRHLPDDIRPQCIDSV